jgi:hypothetical protein
MKNLSLALAACCLLSAGAAGRAADKDKPTSNELKQIGVAFFSYHDANRKGPAKAEDLAPYFDKENRERMVGLMKSEAVVFIFNVGILEMPEGTSNTVLAYVKEAPKEGGLVLYGDGSVKTLKADEFKKATLAKPKAKPKDK